MYASIASIAVSLISSIMSSNATTSAADKAAESQSTATRESIAEQRRQFDKTMGMLQPYISSGETALTSQMALAGLSGPEAQQKELDLIQNSPGFKETIEAGEQGILSNASATGGLRGGNVQGALSQYRPQMLQQAIANRYNQLGGLSTMGQNSATGSATIGQSNSNNISSLLSNLGEIQGQSAMVRGIGQAKAYGNIAGTVGTLAGDGKLDWLNDVF